MYGEGVIRPPPYKSLGDILKKLLGLIILIVCMFSAPYAYADHNGSSPEVSIYGRLAVTNNHYDINYDGETCFQWLTDWHPAVVLHPIVIYSTPLDDFDLIQIIACMEK